jgi:ATP adenylyltransferase
MTFDDLLKFITADMRMSHIYQPVMIRHLLRHGGRGSVQEIATALLVEDQSQVEYYSQITNNMVGRVLRRHEVVAKGQKEYELLGFDDLSPSDIQRLVQACDTRLNQYLENRGSAIWEHRRNSSGYISGTLRYEVLKHAKYRCELCGISAEEKALEVDHIIPRSKGGVDELANLQALCYSCNAMKRDRDDTDFRLVKASYEEKSDTCPFCDISDRPILFENNLAIAFEDIYPVSKGHVLVLPRRHEPNYFKLGLPEVRACHDLLSQAQEKICQSDPTVMAFNVGINCGTTAGQTVMHCHVHLIPRRDGDHPNPRGGVRGVIPGKADYSVKRA